MILLPARYALILAITLLVFAGCASMGANHSGSTLRIWYSTDDPVERAWSQTLTHQFQRSHPRVRVQLTDYSFADLNTKLQLALQAGTPPDLAYVTPRGPGIPAYVRAGTVRNLTREARQRGWAGRLGPEFLRGYNQPFSFFGAPRGAVMAVPTSLAAVGVLYNRRLLNRLHGQLPTSLAQFDALLARAKALGYTPIGLGNADGWLGDDWYLTLVNSLASPAQLMPEFVLSRRFSFSQPPFVQAARILEQWSKHNYFTTDFGGLDAQEGIDQFFRGRTLFQLISSSQNPQIAQDQRETRLPIGVFAFPGPPGGVLPVSGYLGWIVPASSKHPQQAIDFIDSLLNRPTAQLLSSHGVLPATRFPSIGPRTPEWQREYVHALTTARAGVYLDAAPVPNLNATMEANVQLLLQGYEGPDFLVQSLQKNYTSHQGNTARIDGEF